MNYHVDKLTCFAQRHIEHIFDDHFHLFAINKVAPDLLLDIEIILLLACSMLKTDEVSYTINPLCVFYHLI